MVKTDYAPKRRICKFCGEEEWLVGYTWFHACGPRAEKKDDAPWYTPLIYFVSTVLMAYALIWLATAFVDKADCWSSVDSTGCAILWSP